MNRTNENLKTYRVSWDFYRRYFEILLFKIKTFNGILYRILIPNIPNYRNNNEIKESLS